MEQVGNLYVHSSKDDVKKVLFDFNDTKKEYSEYLSIHQLFEQQVKLTPDSIAVAFGNESLTYIELNQKANQLARILRNHSVGPDIIVGLEIERSTEMIIGILAILKAGGAYLPIDPQFPKSRIEYIIEDSGINILVTQSTISFREYYYGDIINIDDPKMFDGDNTNLDNTNQPCDMIYVIYTSGSTGNPKGVVIEHKSVFNFIYGVCDKIDFSPQKRIVSLTTVSFDIHILETLLALCKGLTIIIADPRLFYQTLENSDIDMLQTTPSTLQLILSEEKNLKYIKNLKETMIGGEVFPTRLLKQLRKYTYARIYNMYGPTETTVWSTIKDVTTDDEITIGKPISNTYIYILDEKCNPHTVGKVGELCISGDGVARGYYNRTELTLEKFIESPFVEEQRLYKTGDLAKWLPSGEIEYIGRIDNQVKVRGFRIELEEIELCLLKNNNIRECIVIVGDATDGSKYLVAYYVSENNISVSELITHLSKFLPEYMIPGFYIRLEKIPLAPNGKLNRSALPEPESIRPELDTLYQAPKNDIENTIASIWKKILVRDKVGVNDNFFELGGNSILLSEMYSEIEKIFPGRVDITQLFSYPTVSKLVKFINQKESQNNSCFESYFLKLPMDYFCGNSLNEGSCFEFKIGSDVFEGIKEVSKEFDTDVFTLFQSVLICLLSEISGSKEVGYLFRQNINDIFEVAVNLSNNQNFSSSVKEVKESLLNKKVFDYDKISKIKVNALNKNLVIITIIDEKLSGDSKVPGSDISLYMRELISSLHCKCELNNKRLKKEKVQEIMVLCLKFLKTIIMNFTSMKGVDKE